MAHLAYGRAPTSALEGQRRSPCPSHRHLTRPSPPLPHQTGLERPRKGPASRDSGQDQRGPPRLAFLSHAALTLQQCTDITFETCLESGRRAHLRGHPLPAALLASLHPATGSRVASAGARVQPHWPCCPHTQTAPNPPAFAALCWSPAQALGPYLDGLRELSSTPSLTARGSVLAIGGTGTSPGQAGALSSSPGSAR